MKIVVAGDFLPTECNWQLFAKGTGEEIYGEKLLSVFSDCDFSIANMEGVISENITPIKKSGPIVHAPIETMNGVNKLGVKCFSLANNHVLDCGGKELLFMLEELKTNGYMYVGAGKNADEADKPLIIGINGYKVGIYSCAEHEFTIASDSCPGANPYNEIKAQNQIASLKASVDCLIVIYHGGKEYYRYPAPYLVDRCHHMIECGADFIFCQHSHCIGCYENYKGAQVVYGQGNFFFCRKDNEYTRNGLIAEITLPQKELCFIPVERKGNVVRLSPERTDILEEFAKRSEEIKSADFIEKNYLEFCRVTANNAYKNSLGYIGEALYYSKILRWLGRRFYAEKHLLRLLNDLQCEAHRDMLITALKDKIGL